MDSVIFAGFQNKLDYLPAFDLFCVPSPGEPFGLVTVEASAMGVPVLAFKTGGTMEIITKNVDGFLLSRVDHISLAEAIIRLSKDKKLLAKVSRNAVKNVKKRFDIKIMMHKMIGIVNAEISGS